VTGGRLNRFNIVKQSKDYDQNGDYVRRWLPELKDVPTEFVHEPWKMTQFQQTEFNVQLGVDYPHPIVPPSKPSHGSSGKPGERRRPNNNTKQNRHQKFEMKSVKTGSYNIH
jgi:deoxyribodipyrimidine photo-lyase